MLSLRHIKINAAQNLYPRIARAQRQRDIAGDNHHISISHALESSGWFLI
jgi:hypothetical protein